MSDLDSVVNVAITVQSGALSVTGFGVPLLLPASVPAAFTERLRYYTSVAAMLDDGFLTTDWAYIAATALMSQRPRPRRFAVGRRATALAQFQLFVTPATPDSTTLYRVVINGTNCDYTTDGTATQAELQTNLISAINTAVGSAVTATASGNDVLVTADVAGIPFTYSIAEGPATPLTYPAQTRLFVIPAAPANSTLYRVTINGVPCDFTTDASASQAELQAGILAAINANVGSAVTATTATNDVLVTADVAGTNFSWEIMLGPSPAITAGAGTGAQPNVGIAEDLTSISEYQPDWYALLIEQRTEEHILVAAGAIEAQTKMFFAQSNDAAILNAPYNPADTTTDIASRLRGLGYVRTALWYHPEDDEALDAAVVGRCIGAIPGSLTWKFKELAGVTATRLTETQRTNLESKNANGYRPLAGRSITYEGKTAQGRFIDITHGLDKMQSRIQELVAGSLIALEKVPMTDPGLAVITADISTGIGESEREGFVAPSVTLPNGDIMVPSWKVTAPKVADIPAADREARRIPASNPFVFEGVFAGATHSVEVAGTLSF